MQPRLVMCVSSHFILCLFISVHIYVVGSAAGAAVLVPCHVVRSLRPFGDRPPGGIIPRTGLGICCDDPILCVFNVYVFEPVLFTSYIYTTGVFPVHILWFGFLYCTVSNDNNKAHSLQLK